MSCNGKNEWLTFKINNFKKIISKKINFKDQLKCN